MKKTDFRLIAIITVIVAIAVIATAAVVAIITVQMFNKAGQELATTKEPYRTSGIENISNAGFVPVNVTIVRNHITLISGCSAIAFDVTDDQAISIFNALEKTTTVRPLAHEIMRDIIEEFGIKVLATRIEKYENDIYYARMFLQHGDRILDLDARPSDTIALSLRTGNILYMNETMLNERGINIC